jgi:signal peptidase I
MSERIYSIVGVSMNPTLFEPMILETIRVDRYYPGDVVVFNSVNDKTIVHRIIKVNQTGFITRGDNNLTDDEPIDYQDVLGKVVMAFRGNKQYKVCGNKQGYLLHRYLQIKKKLLHRFIHLFVFGYHLLSLPGIFVHFLPKKYRPRIIQFENGQAHLYSANILVGRYNVRRHHWIIFRPWRFFIDEKKLPIPNI